MLKYIITPVAICCFSLSVYADDLALKAGHPESYTVQKGDTLWGISGKFLNEPWLWPQVWKMNREQIKNPHRIYPGDVIVVDKNGANPSLRLLRETVNLDPHSVVEPLDKEGIKTIPANIIAPFLSKPLVIENDELGNARNIVESRGNRVALSTGNKIYVNDIEKEDGLYWHIYRPGKEMKDPVTQELLGTEGVYLGSATVVKYGDPASLEISSSNQEILKGDKLIAAVDRIEPNYVPRAPEAEIQGYIIDMYGGVAEGAENSIVTLNKGKRDGLEDGHVLAIYREGELKNKDKALIEAEEARLAALPEGEKMSSDERKAHLADYEKLKLPNERVGLVMVFRTFDKVSYGLIVQSDEPIYVKDIVQKP